MSRSAYFQTLSFLESSVLMQSQPSIKALRKWAADLGEHGSLSFVGPLDLDPDYIAQLGEALTIDAFVVRTPPAFSPSAANRDRVRAVLSAKGPPRVWEPQGLWEMPSAAKLAAECGAMLAMDPLGADPLDEAVETLAAQIASGRAYLRLSGLGMARQRFREYDLESVAELVQDLDEGWVVFGNPGAHKDARALSKLLGAGVSS